jgi:tRNA-splicing ligase RtcB
MALPATVYISAGMEVEETALRQLADAGRLPGVKRLLATPDIHQGYGVPIGCVVGLKGYVVPAAVGYDVNCGMRLLTTPMKAADISPETIARAIGSKLPLGEGKHNVTLPRADFERVIAGGVPALAKVNHALLASAAPDWRKDEFESDVAAIEDNGALEGDPDAVSKRAMERGIDQLCTLGGGNHFVEIQRVDHVFDAAKANRFGLFEGQFVLMLHSGSRGFGHQVGDDYMHEASRLHGGESPNSSLAFLRDGEPAGRRYIGAMRAAANFAFVNRELMAMTVRSVVRSLYGQIPIRTVYDVPHNITKKERHNGEDIWVHRKGATRAFPPERMAGTPFEDCGSPVLIPGSMGTASYVLLPGPNAEETLASVNHGAGRRMSRTAAAGGRHGRMKHAAAISDADFREAMKGIFLFAADPRSAKEEAPQAYKDIDEVIEVVTGAGLALPVARLKPLAVLKG